MIAEQIACHACTAGTIKAITDRLVQANPQSIEALEQILQTPVPLELLAAPEITGEHLAPSAGYKHPPYGEMDKFASGSG